MVIWNVLLYALGTVLALRSLVSMMASHKQQLEFHHLKKQRIEAKRLAKKQALAKAAEARAAEAEPSAA